MPLGPLGRMARRTAAGQTRAPDDETGSVVGGRVGDVVDGTGVGGCEERWAVLRPVSTLR